MSGERKDKGPSGKSVSIHLISERSAAVWDPDAKSFVVKKITLLPIPKDVVEIRQPAILRERTQLVWNPTEKRMEIKENPKGGETHE